MSNRISLFPQLKAFYEGVWHGDKDFTPFHIALYFFLINQNNRNEWAEWFKVSYDLGMKGSCIGSKTTYYKTLRNLEEWGYIRYEEGSNSWKTPRISINPLCSKGRKIPFMEEVVSHNHTTTRESIRESSATSTGNQVVPQVGTNKDLKTNTETIRLGRFVPPTQEEAITQFLLKGSNEVEAMRFWNHYDSNGWKVGKNKMQKWKSAASLWLSRDYSTGGNKKPRESTQERINRENWARMEQMQREEQLLMIGDENGQ